MPDVKGPYKIVIKKGVAGRTEPIFSIAVERKLEGALVILVPDAGDAQTSRDICNLLNKNHWEIFPPTEETDEQAVGTDGAGVPDPDLGVRGSDA